MRLGSITCEQARLPMLRSETTAAVARGEDGDERASPSSREFKRLDGPLTGKPLWVASH